MAEDEDTWSTWLACLQGWAQRTRDALLSADLVLPPAPAGMPTVVVPPALRLRAQLVLEELGQVETAVRRRREQLTREHAYS